MNKSEADRIIEACKKFKVESCIRKEVEEYYINFIKIIDVKEYESAKLIVNALIIEKRNNPKYSEKYEESDVLIPTSIKSKYYKKKIDFNPEIEWGNRNI